MTAGALTWVSNAGQQGSKEKRVHGKDVLRGGVSLAWWLVGIRGQGGGNGFLAQASR